MRYFSNFRERPSDRGDPRPAWPQTWDIWLKQKVTKYVSQPGSRFQLDCNHSFHADSCGAKHKVVLSLCSVVKCGAVTGDSATCPLQNPSCQTFSPEHRIKLGTGQLLWHFSFQILKNLMGGHTFSHWIAGVWSSRVNQENYWWVFLQELPARVLYSIRRYTKLLILLRLVFTWSWSKTENRKEFRMQKIVMNNNNNKH